MYVLRVKGITFDRFLFKVKGNFCIAALEYVNLSSYMNKYLFPKFAQNYANPAILMHGHYYYLLTSNARSLIKVNTTRPKFELFR